jgi:hypothetical protein
VPYNGRESSAVRRGKESSVPFSVTYLDEHHVVETVYSGVLGPGEFEAAVAATGDAAGEYLCTRFLSDCRGLAAGDQSATLDIWTLAEFLGSLPQGVFEREALLLPAAAAAGEEIAFYETTCRNRGLAVRIFTGRGEALDWLTS